MPAKLRLHSLFRPAMPAILLLASLHATLLTAAEPPADTSRGRSLFFADSFEPGPGLQGAPGWERWSQREQSSPELFTAAEPSLGASGSLGLTGASNNSAHGGWRRVVQGVEPGTWYRLRAWYTAENVPYPRQQVLSRLEWLDAKGERTAQPEYPGERLQPGRWQLHEGLFQAPPQAAAARIELYLSYCPQGRVWFDCISLQQVDDPGRRMARVATVNHLPTNTGSSRASVESFLPLLEEAGRQGCDIVCLGEGINMAGTGKGYPEIAEPIPGPTTELLGQVARRHGMYIVAAIGEREHQAIYNTAVLIDRQGRVAGKYHKVQLPREELEGGCTPGHSFPVFDTDFGRIGMMVCWDLQYTLPAQALAVQGAEIIFLPIWGGTAPLVPARAIENQVWLVSSCYENNLPTAIWNPRGEVVARAERRGTIAWSDIDLNQRFYDDWLGNMRDRFARERRADVVLPELAR